MKAVGVFRELEPQAVPGLESIFEARGRLSNELVRPVLDHLARGVAVVDVMEATSDPIDGQTAISGGSSLESDGVWVWRSDLKYFVEKYQVGLSEPFIKHVLHVKDDRTLPDEARVLAQWQVALRAYRSVVRGAK